MADEERGLLANGDRIQPEVLAVLSGQSGGGNHARLPWLDSASPPSLSCAPRSTTCWTAPAVANAAIVVRGVTHFRTIRPRSDS